MKPFDGLKIDDIVKAVIEDEPELASHADKLARSLKDVQEMNIKMAYINPAQLRQRANLSQNQFADALGISVNTLRSWEQGQRQPSGAVRVLLSLLNKHPNLVAEIV